MIATPHSKSPHSLVLLTATLTTALTNPKQLTICGPSHSDVSPKQ